MTGQRTSKSASRPGTLLGVLKAPIPSAQKPYVASRPVTSVHGQLGELDEPLSWGSRALAIAHGLGNLELRILTTTYLDSLSA